MTETREKSDFDVKGVTTMTVYEAGIPLVFNAQRVGPVDYEGLRSAEYGFEGRGFEAPTFGELAPLIRASLHNLRIPQVYFVAQTLRQHWMSGKTLAVPGREGLLVDDSPDLDLIQNSKSYESALMERLGSREEKGVVYSDDGLVRFTPHGFPLKGQSFSDLSRNRGLIALTGSGERAGLLAETSKHYPQYPFLDPSLGKQDSTKLRVPCVGSGLFYGSRLVFDSDNLGFVGRFSFGIKKVPKVA